MSIDQVFSHIKWDEWIAENLGVEIQFPIIAANDTIAYKMGMLHPKSGSNTVRAVFVGDPEGKIRLILYYPQELGRNMDENRARRQACRFPTRKGGHAGELAQ